MPRELVDNDDVKMTMLVLAESVASRLRDHGFKCRTVQISVSDNDLNSFERQAKLQRPSQVSNDILTLAMKLFEANYSWSKPIRSVGVRGADLVSALRTATRLYAVKPFDNGTALNLAALL